jgi:ABC-type lipoprotein export system ATPase subunit
MKYKLAVEKLSVNGYKIADFSAEFSRMLLIKGRIGSGKTLLLKALAGVYETEGYLEFSSSGGSSVVGEGCFVHSQPEFNFVTGRVGDEAEFAGVDPAYFSPLRNRRTKELSGGELKRISVMMALLSKYALLLLDEPLDMLDDEEFDSLAEYIIKVSCEKAVIIATHSDRFDSAADGIIFLENEAHTVFKPDTIPAVGETLLSMGHPYPLILRAGEIAALYGKNGSGKTRILRNISGLT